MRQPPGQPMVQLAPATRQRLSVQPEERRRGWVTADTQGRRVTSQIDGGCAQFVH